MVSEKQASGGQILQICGMLAQKTDPSSFSRDVLQTLMTGEVAEQLTRSFSGLLQRFCTGRTPSIQVVGRSIRGLVVNYDQPLSGLIKEANYREVSLGDLDFSSRQSGKRNLDVFQVKLLENVPLGLMLAEMGFLGLRPLTFIELLTVGAEHMTLIETGDFAAYVELGTIALTGLHGQGQGFSAYLAACPRVLRASPVRGVCPKECNLCYLATLIS